MHKTAEEDTSHDSTPPPAPAPSPAPVPVVVPAPPAPLRTVTPVAQTTPAPAASTSNNYTYGKPIAIRPRSAQLSPDMEVDIMSPEPDGHGDNRGVERDEETEEIVRQLEKGLPRWPGFGEEGWRGDISQVSLDTWKLGGR